MKYFILILNAFQSSIVCDENSLLSYKELEQKERQKSALSKEVDEAEDHQEVLKNDLVKICQSLQKVSTTAAMLARRKERLELSIARMEIKQKRISAALASKPSKEHVSEMVDEVHLTIIDLKEDLHHVETDISDQTAKEEHVKQKLSKKEKEADENRQALEDLKEKLVLFSSALNFQSDSFAEGIRHAENRQKELDRDLQDICKSLQPLTRKSASLAEEKEELEKEITENEKLQEELLSQKASMEGMGIFVEILANIQASINTNRKSLAHVEAKVDKKKAEKNEFKLEAAKKETELDENKRVVCDLKQKHSVICSVLEAKRKIFDFQLRQKHQSKKKLEEECQVSASCMPANISFHLNSL